MEIPLPESDYIRLKRVADDYNYALKALGTSLRWTPETLALRILKEGINGRVDFLPTSNHHDRYPA